MLIRSGQSAQSRAVDRANHWHTLEGQQQLGQWKELGHGNQASLNEAMAGKDPGQESSEVANAWLDDMYNSQPTRISRRNAKTYKYDKKLGKVVQIA